MDWVKKIGDVVWKAIHLRSFAMKGQEKGAEAKLEWEAKRRSVDWWKQFPGEREIVNAEEKGLFVGVKS